MALEKNNIKSKFKDVEYISLGCTHFKYIQNFIKQIYGGNIKFFECEKQVAKNSKWLIRKNKKQSSLNLILTTPNQNLEKMVYDMFYGAVKK